MCMFIFSVVEFFKKSIKPKNITAVSGEKDLKHISKQLCDPSSNDSQSQEKSVLQGKPTNQNPRGKIFKHLF